MFCLVVYTILKSALKKVCRRIIPYILSRCAIYSIYHHCIIQMICLRYMESYIYISWGIMICSGNYKIFNLRALPDEILEIQLRMQKVLYKCNIIYIYISSGMIHVEQCLGYSIHRWGILWIFCKQNMALSENKVPQNPMVYYHCPT